MAERVRVRDITSEEGNRLLRILRRGTGSVVTWRRAQMLLLSGQGMPILQIAEVTFTSPDRVRDVIHNFNADGLDSIYPRYRGGRPPRFTLTQRQQIKKIALSRPADHDLPFSTWSLAKLADFLVAVLQFLVLHGRDLELEPPAAARELLRGLAAGTWGPRAPRPVSSGATVIGESDRLAASAAALLR